MARLPDYEAQTLPALPLGLLCDVTVLGFSQAQWKVTHYFYTEHLAQLPCCNQAVILPMKNFSDLFPNL